ncbi:MAG: (2Fe-2S) ferredoxin domain-containing protein [Clostridia bacterium]
MMKLLVCVGSSCHLKGSYDVIQQMMKIIKKYGVEDQVDLQASFCLGNCANGVMLKADEMLLHNVNIDNAEDIFLKDVYPILNKEKGSL